MQADSLTGTIRTTVPLKIGQRHKSSPLSGATIQDVRVYARRLADGEIASLANSALSAVVAAPPDKRSEADVDSLYDWWLTSRDETFKTLAQQHDALMREQADIKARGTIAHVMQEKPEAAMAFVLNRGEYDQRQRSGDARHAGDAAAVPRRFAAQPAGLRQVAAAARASAHGARDGQSVLEEVFGTGLVKTAGDFGVSGELPSHPELLDWLAVEFRESGWDVKQLFKLIVTSAAYRQSAAVDAGEAGKGSGQPAAVARAAVPHGCRDGSRLRAGGERAVVGEDRRAEREAVPAAGRVGGGGDDRQRTRATTSRTRASRCIAAACTRSGSGRRRRRRWTCSTRRTARTATMVPRADQHAAAGAGDAERSAVRRSGPAAGAAGDLKRAPTSTSGINFIAERLLARPLRPKELAIVREFAREVRARITPRTGRGGDRS